MVQREVADRFFASPRTKAYGAVSVLVQLAAERTGFHPVSREVFRPRPNVDSALVAFRRTRPGIDPRVKRLVEASFAHRRKTLANSLALSGTATRERAAAALEAIGRASRRPGRGAHPARVRRARRGARMISAPCAGEDQPRPRRRADPARRHARGRNPAAADRPRRHGLARARPPELAVDGFPDDTLVRAALVEIAAAAGVEPRWRARLEKRIPVAAGLGGGSSDAATALRLACRLLDDPPPPERLHAIGAPRSASTSPSSSPKGHSSVPAPGQPSRRSTCRRTTPSLLLLPRGATKPSTAEIYGRFDGADGFEERRARVLEIAAAGQAADLAALPPNDLAASPLARRLSDLGAFRADVSGAGPAVYGLFTDREEAERAAAELEDLGETWLATPAW